MVKNIIREIIEVSLAAGHSINDGQAAFMVKAVVLDPQSGFKTETELTKADIAKLVEVCVARLTDETSVSLGTMNMQVAFGQLYKSYGECKTRAPLTRTSLALDPSVTQPLVSSLPPPLHAYMCSIIQLRRQNELACPCQHLTLSFRLQS